MSEEDDSDGRDDWCDHYNDRDPNVVAALRDEQARDESIAGHRVWCPAFDDPESACNCPDGKRPDPPVPSVRMELARLDALLNSLAEAVRDEADTEQRNGAVGGIMTSRLTSVTLKRIIARVRMEHGL